MGNMGASMIRAYCIDDITIVKWAGEDSWGEPLATSDVDVKGKINYATRLVRDIRGQEVLSVAMIYLPGDIDDDLGRSLDHEDKLKFDGINHAILKIIKPKAFSGPHYEVYVA